MVRFFSVLMFLVVVATGCGNLNRTPRYDVPQPLEIETFKRYTKHPQRDFIHQFKKTAFSPVKKPLTKRLSESQQAILERHGQPDWVRSNFTGHTGEKVTEWIWWDRSITAQFVQRELVYEGTTTDMDRWLIRYGYPRRAWYQDDVDGVRRDIWDYQPILFSPRGRIITFTNGKLISHQDY